MISLHKTRLKLSILIMDINNLNGPYAPNSRSSPVVESPGYLGLINANKRNITQVPKLGNDTLS